MWGWEEVCIYVHGCKTESNLKMVSYCSVIVGICNFVSYKIICLNNKRIYSIYPNQTDPHKTSSSEILKHNVKDRIHISETSLFHKFYYKTFPRMLSNTMNN
jgi:hypothetical protein